MCRKGTNLTAISTLPRFSVIAFDEAERLTGGHLRAIAFRLPELTRGELVGYSTVVALGVLPALWLAAVAPFVALPARGQGDYPFVTFSLAILAVILMVRPLQLVATLHPAPLRQLRDDVARHSVWLTLVVIMVIVVPETLDVATRVKKIIPQIQPFYADRAIALAENAVLGRDAWQLTHALLGRTATRAIDLVYGLWHLVNISMLCWIVLTPNRRFQLQAVLSYQLAWLLMGALLAVALSSVGPCYYQAFTGDARFAPLMRELTAVNGPEGLHSLVAMKYLLATRNTDAFGGGISAMPSLHVAIAVYSVLMARLAWPARLLPALGASAYAVAIFVGSVHLGWHYALDGIVSALVMLAIWHGVAAWLRWLFLRYG